MDTGETTGAKPAPRRPRAEPAEPPYEGVVGRTRLETVHVTIPGGYVRSVQVYTAVNVASDPELREPATSGALHRFEGGEELAIPFVFHDPSARKFALVLPEALRHREFVERAELLRKLAEDTDHGVPPYVREARVVIGTGELVEYLAREGSADGGLREREEELDARESQLSARESQLSSRDAELGKRHEELERQVERLVDRERRLQARAEDVTRWEDELRMHQEELEAARRDLAVREQELERRFALVQQREQELAEGKRSSMRPRSVPPPTPGSASPPRPRASSPPAGPAGEDDVEELEDFEPVQIDTNVALADAVELIPEDGEEVATLGTDDVEEIVDEGDVEEIEDFEAAREVTGVEPVPEPATDENEVDEPKTLIGQAHQLPGPDVSPPPRFLSNRDTEMMAGFSDGVWLFVRLDEGREETFREHADLLVQLADVQGYPVVVLALVEATDGRPYVRHAALDPYDTDDRRILEALRQRYEATVALFGPDGRFERTVEVSAARRVNVAMILERIDRRTEKPRIDAQTAIERALAVPPPVREAGLPFQTEEPPPSENAMEAARALDGLVEWSRPDRLEHAMLSLSVPRDVVDGSMRRILGDAVRHGVALPPALVSRAVSVGVAAEPGELVQRQIDAFRRTCTRPDRGGLTPEQIADNWEQLLKAAADAEVPIDGETHELAWKAIREMRGGSQAPGSLAGVDPAKLPDMGPPELVLLLDHPRVRREAALELCRRGDPEFLDTLFKAVRKMPRAEVVRVVPRIAEFGEPAADVLIDGLGAKKTFVRQAAALALGHLKLRRAVVPLVHLLQNEPSDVWREVARVLGELGTGATRALTRGVKDAKGQRERFVWALAHLANHGCAKQVQELASDADARVAEVARQALTLREEAKAAAAEVRGERPLCSQDPVKLFSHRFYAELAGTAPKVDLADVDE